MADFVSHNTQRPSGNVISADLKNNIGLATILGDFGTSESTLTLDDDYSALAKPNIKGRGFIKTGQEVIEYQSFYVDKDTTVFTEKKGFYDKGEKIDVPEEGLPDLEEHLEKAEEISVEIEKASDEEEDSLPEEEFNFKSKTLDEHPGTKKISLDPSMMSMSSDAPPKRKIKL